MTIQVADTTDTTDALADDMFSAAFDEGILGDEPVKDPTDTKVDADPVVVIPEVVAPVAEQVVTPPVVEPVVDIKAIVAEAVAATRASEPAKVDPVVEPPAAVTQTPEELAAEEQYKKDWPEHYAREQRLKSDVVTLKAVLDEAIKAIQGQVAPVVASAQQTAEEKHLTAITTAHPDALAIVPDVEKWVATQPKFLQPQYNAVLESGSAADIVELFSLYKTQTAVQVTAPVTIKDELAEKRLQRMEVPTAVRTSVTAEPDVDDFDAGFDRGAAQLKM